MKSLNQSGVTIVEILVVVAIISLVFVVTVAFLQQYFGKESFRQTTQLLVGDFNNVIHEVRTDVTPADTGVLCYRDLITGELQFAPDADAKPGEHKDCSLYGKAVQLGVALPAPDPPGTVTDLAEDYIIHDLIGLVEDNKSSLQKFQVFHDAVGNVVDTSEVKKVPQGGGFIKAVYFETGGSPPNDKVFLDGFAVVISKFGAVSNTAGDFVGGSRNLSLWAIYPQATPSDRMRTRKFRSDPNPANLGFEEATKAHDLSAHQTVYYHQLARGQTIFVCLESGVGEEWAFIRVGSAKGALEAEVERDSETARNKCETI